MEEMYNNVENETTNEELTPVEENFEELVPQEEEVDKPTSSGALETALILAGTAVVGHMVISWAAPGVKKGVKTVAGWGKNLISKGKKSKTKTEKENSEGIVEAECKEVETPDEKEDVEG